MTGERLRKHYFSTAAFRWPARLSQEEYTSAVCSKVPSLSFVKGETSEFGNERRENKTVELMTTSSIEYFSQGASMSSVTILYSDFNCPFCYAMHERLHEMNLLALCEWRGVQHASHLPLPMKLWQGSLGAELRHEVTVVQRLAPGLPIALPSGKPNTGPAIEQAVALARRDPSHMMTFVRETYRAFWCEGRDISDPGVLRQLAEQVGVSPESINMIDGEDRRVAQEWETAWHLTGQAGVPLIVSQEGELLVGCQPPEDIRRFFDQGGG
jgi:predicted DsbA family dithiol-disulfide isomerase